MLDTSKHIQIRGACQNNLKALDLDIALHTLTVVTGVSGSGKSSLAFDTVYAEGQRRYVETFSPYARQFLARMDKPVVDQITGIPPAVAIDQTNPVRTSRSTVGTMTELNDHIKLLYARGARLHCHGCGEDITRDTPEDVSDAIFQRCADGVRIYVLFMVQTPEGFPAEEVSEALRKQGYDRLNEVAPGFFEVIQDRMVLQKRNRGRLLDSIEAAYRHGEGQVIIRTEDGAEHRFSADLHCARCHIRYRDAVPNLFSFNSPLGACEVCRGFGRTIGIDYGLVIPDESLSLQAGAIRPWQSKSYQECQQDLEKFARTCKVPLDVPWRELREDQQDWVKFGDGQWEDGKWYGIQGFFDWLEGRSYKMHVRVLLSRYRAYHECESCHGARLKPEALCWRLGTGDGLSMHDVMLLPLSECRPFFDGLHIASQQAEAVEPLLEEIRTRLHYLCEAGLGYLTLDRQSRTLSGGEVQRINLTTALGTTLVNTLFVLDEPTIGLHARDTARIIEILRRLRDAGNTLIVVEHDPEVICAADEVIDIGPGAGNAGGYVIYKGNVQGLLDNSSSVTGAYLRGEKEVGANMAWLPPPTSRGPFLSVRGAAEHNLKKLDLDIPLRRMVCFTGVSGSGKSTLLETCIYRGLLRARGESTEQPGAVQSIESGEKFSQIVLIDQRPLGKTTRSNPASYTGAWTAIRSLFAKAPLAHHRGYKPGTFSFNSGLRCEACGGSGFQHVEMQFLSDVYLRCSQCDGSRFQSEVLDIHLDLAGHPNVNVSDVLDMTVDTAREAFADYPAVLKALSPLASTGLGYVRLGQPVTTLSGGEAQRLKLASYLQDAHGAAGPILFLLDEPTTGLHMSDIAILLQALRALVLEGHSVLVIEHHLDVIRTSDWLIDLGPEGGDAGGEVLFTGTPKQIMQCEKSYTGHALREESKRREALVDTRELRIAAESQASYFVRGPNAAIELQGAREHNLQGINIQIPKDKFTVITGLSGSGKSTVAFDILYKEGQRRYLDSLNAYARQFVQPAARPDVDAVIGVPPTVAIEQRISRGGLKSTVATITEIYHFLRLLFAKLGTQYCPDCQIPITPQSPEQILASIQKDFARRRVQLLVPLVKGRKGIYRDLASTWAGRGYQHLLVDGKLASLANWPKLARYREHDISLPLGEFSTGKASVSGLMLQTIKQALDIGEGQLLVQLVSEEKKGRSTTRIYSSTRACAGCGRSFGESDPRLFSFHSSHGWCESCSGTGLALRAFTSEDTGEEGKLIAAGRSAKRCRSCEGTRLRPEALAVRFLERNICQFASDTVEDALAFFSSLTWETEADAQIGETLRQEIVSRLHFLAETGLSYLSLDRSAPTLSGGEAQRIRLASQLGSNLCGVCYVLDEPTIGLHPRDNDQLLSSLRKLKDKGNVVVVVEHDEDTILQADHVIDLGPGAGSRGGYVVASGTPAEILANPASVTGQALSARRVHPIAGKRRSCSKRGKASAIEVKGAHLHNLQNINVRFPLGRLISVTGVSGSGKSTLVHDVLFASLQRKNGKTIGCRSLAGRGEVERVREVDQTPIGRTPRSCPATYVGFWDDIRKLLANLPESRMRGWQANHFSFNTGEGRCPVCGGNGYLKVEMNFLPDVRVRCDDCGGRRFTAETHQVRFKGFSVSDILALSVEDAIPVFEAHPKILRPLKLMHDVGLGYLTLGQHSPTLSGGEAQRIKLVSELARRADSAGTLYVLDEPTIGLHAADIVHLVKVLHRLVESGATVVVIEHHSAVIAESDWVIDLGPDGGNAGGQLVCQGTPEKLAKTKTSHTGTFLQALLR